MTCAFYSIVYDIVFLIERKINYFILFLFYYLPFNGFPATSAIQSFSKDFQIQLGVINTEVGRTIKGPTKAIHSGSQAISVLQLR
jgi:hypothetical protein